MKALHTVAAWQSTQDTDTVPLADARPEQRFSIVWRLLLQLLDANARPAAVKAAISARRRRGKQRWMGLHALLALLNTTDLSSVQREMVVQLSPALCATGLEASRGAAPHLFDGLAACGDDVRTAVRCVTLCRLQSPHALNMGLSPPLACVCACVCVCACACVGGCACVYVCACLCAGLQGSLQGSVHQVHLLPQAIQRQLRAAHAGRPPCLCPTVHRP